MRARELMSSPVITVAPTTPVREIARLLLTHGVSAVPVLDAAGAVVGIVSEGDLIGPDNGERAARRDWWLALLAEGQPLAPEFLDTLRTERTAAAVLSAPVIAVGEDTEGAEIARLFAAHRINRVPVLRGAELVGIVSRADLVRALANGAFHAQAVRAAGGVFAFAQRVLNRGAPEPPAPAPSPTPSPAAPADEPPATAAAFRGLVQRSESEEAERRAALRRALAEERKKAVQELVAHHLDDAEWNALLHHAREAAAHGKTEFLMLRFPSALCSDSGRAVNAPSPDWPQTLQGEAAEMFARWERELKPAGFRIAARVLEFPDGVPGDIGLFLVWGG